MGLLQLAGAVSGMGQGLGQGLTNLQTGIQRMGLQQEDRQFQKEQLVEQNRYAEARFEREQEGLTARHTATEKSRESQHQSTLGSNILLHGIDQYYADVRSKDTIAAQASSDQQRTGTSIVTEGMRQSGDRERAKALETYTTAQNVLKDQLERLKLGKDDNNRIAMEVLGGLKSADSEVATLTKITSVAASAPLFDKDNPGVDYLNNIEELKIARKTRALYGSLLLKELKITIPPVVTPDTPVIDRHKKQPTNGILEQTP